MQILQVLGCSFQVADLVARDTFTAICRSAESSVLYTTELLQCDCHEPNISTHCLGWIYRSRNGSRQFVRDEITTSRQRSDTEVNSGDPN